MRQGALRHALAHRGKIIILLTKFSGKKLLTYTKNLYFCNQFTYFKENEHEKDTVFIACRYVVL